MTSGPVIARNAEVANVYAMRLFDRDQCEHLLAAVPPDAWEEGRAYGPADGSMGQLRSVEQQVLPGGDEGPLPAILAAVRRLNAEHWRFDLDGLVAEDPPVLLRYDGGRGDLFDWHVDLGPLNPTRKLSFSIQLDDGDAYDGGDLEFVNLRFPAGTLRARGTMVVFPSFLCHRVTATTRGRRHAVVGWVHGPAFR